MKTQLNDRILWFDGTNEVTASDVPELLLQGIPLSKIVASDINEDISLFNAINDDCISSVKNENGNLNFSWNIPSEYKKIDLDSFFLKKMNDKLQHAEYMIRLKLELNEIKSRNLEDLFRCLIFVVDTLKNKSVVWGVGRGSSCASLCLFLMGLHLIDPVKYNIPLTEFFHD